MSSSLEFQKCRFEYASLLNEYGGFNSNVSQYCNEIYQSICNNPSLSSQQFLLSKLYELCSFATGEFNTQANYLLQPVISSHQVNLPFQQINLSSQQVNVSSKEPHFENYNRKESLSTQVELIPENFPVQEVKQIHEKASQQLLSSLQSKFYHDAPSEDTGTGEFYPQANFLSQPIIPTPQLNQDNYLENYNRKESFSPAIESVKENYQEENNQAYEQQKNQQFSREHSNFCQYKAPSEDYGTDEFLSQPIFLPQPIIPTPKPNMTSQDHYLENFNQNECFSSQMESSQENLHVREKKQTYEKENQQNHSNNEGLFGGLKKKLINMIPSSNQMILPDDKNPSVCYKFFQFINSLDIF